MVQVFKGQQFIRILFKNKEEYKLTETIKSDKYYTLTYKQVIQKYKIEARNTKLLVYQMNRKVQNCGLVVVTVILAEVEAWPQLKWSTNEEEVQRYVQKIQPNLSTLDIFAKQGSQVELIK